MKNHPSPTGKIQIYGKYISIAEVCTEKSVRECGYKKVSFDQNMIIES